MSTINHRTHFSCKKSHKDNPQISEIMCYVCYCLQNVINEILTSYVFSHHSLVKDEKIIRFCSILKVLGLYFIV